MNKRTTQLFKKIITNLPKFIIVIASLIAILIFPEEISHGVKQGLFLCAEKIIPALFPFMILATYICASPLTEKFILLFNKTSLRLFRINAYGLMAVILSFLGGYPIGAKIASDLYQEGKISSAEIVKVLPWCVNPGPAFVITAIGSFTLGNTKIGVIMYISIILSAITVGFVTRFFGNVSSYDTKEHTPAASNTNIFIGSVSSATSSMLSVCGWILLFSAITNGLNIVISNHYAKIFLCSIMEVTTGCEILAKNSIPLPVICALLSFGGFAVIFQVLPFLTKCNYSLKYFLCWKVVAGALSSFYCSSLLKYLPITKQTIAIVNTPSYTLSLSHNITATILLMIICIVFVLEVDYKKKIC